MTLAEHTQAYAALDNQLRAIDLDEFILDPDERERRDTFVAQLREDRDKAKAAMEVAWLERQMTS